MVIYAGSFPITDGSQDATRVVFHELYDDRAAFDAHMLAEHTRTLFATLADHLAGRASGQMYDADLVRRDGGG